MGVSSFLILKVYASFIFLVLFLAIKQELDDVGEELLEKYLQEKKGSEENLTSPHSKQESSNNDQQEMEKATKKSDKKKERKRKIEEENQRLQLKVADLQNELQNKKARLSPAAHQEPRSSLQQGMAFTISATSLSCHWAFTINSCF